MTVGVLLVPLVTAMVAAMLMSMPRTQLWVSMAGSVLLLAWATRLVVAAARTGGLSVAVGDWPLPYGIELLADPMSAALILVTALLGLVVLIYQQSSPDPAAGSAMFHPLVHGLLAAVTGVFLAADLFNLYVWLELMFIAILGLMALGATRVQLEATFKYFALNMLGTVLFLGAVALIFGATGQLNFSALADAARRPGVAAEISAPVALLTGALLLKAAAFPLYFWLPASYHTLPASLLALIGGLVTKVAVYVLLRLFAVVFASQPAATYEMLGWIAVATMISGVLGAAYHWDLRRILSFHIISQIGYLLLAVALASAAAGRAGLYFLLHNIPAKAALFLIAGLVWRTAGSYDLRRIGGLYAARPGLAALYLVAAFSLVGLPPSSGFWGKFLLVQEAFAQHRYAWGGVALAVGALTLYSMLKIWLEGFWKPHPRALLCVPAASLAPAYVAVAVLVLVLLALGFYPEPFIRYAGAATAGFWSGPPP